MAASVLKYYRCTFVCRILIRNKAYFPSSSLIQTCGTVICAAGWCRMGQNGAALGETLNVPPVKLVKMSPPPSTLDVIS